MKTKYTENYFIKKFRAIPEDEWCMEKYYDPVTGQHCAMGLCGASPNGDTKESKALVKLFKPFYKYSIYVIDINDGNEETECLGATPQERILVGLTNIKYLNGL